MTLPACRGSGNSAKKFRKTRALLSASGPEEGSCNVIATLRHDQSATDRITPNQVAGRLEVRPESPCRAIPGEPDYVLASKSLRRFRISAFCHELLHAITLLAGMSRLDTLLETAIKRIACGGWSGWRRFRRVDRSQSRR